MVPHCSRSWTCPQNTVCLFPHLPLARGGPDIHTAMIQQLATLSDATMSGKQQQSVASSRVLVCNPYITVQSTRMYAPKTTWFRHIIECQPADKKPRAVLSKLFGDFLGFASYLSLLIRLQDVAIRAHLCKAPIMFFKQNSLIAISRHPHGSE